MEHQRKIEEIMGILVNTYPDNRCELNYETPFQLLVATILAAQATDRKVNEVTAKLFAEYSTADDFLRLGLEGLEQKIKQINLYKSKARHIMATCAILKEKYHGEVPQSLDELIKLPGVGRKTASVVLSYAFGIPAIAVDTHVFRVANRLGIVQAKNPAKTELEMQRVIPRELWSKAHSTLVLHGRRVCDARKPRCSSCTLINHCQFYRSFADIT